MGSGGRALLGEREGERCLECEEEICLRGGLRSNYDLSLIG